MTLEVGMYLSKMTGNRSGREGSYRGGHFEQKYEGRKADDRCHIKGVIQGNSNFRGLM